jgi:hypothetical protein
MHFDESVAGMRDYDHQRNLVMLLMLASSAGLIFECDRNIK